MNPRASAENLHTLRGTFCYFKKKKNACVYSFANLIYLAYYYVEYAVLCFLCEFAVIAQITEHISESLGYTKNLSKNVYRTFHYPLQKCVT